MQPTPKILSWRISWTEEAGGLQVHGAMELDTTEVTEHARVPTHTLIPCFSKMHLTPFSFYERPTLTPIFSNRNPKRIFACVKGGVRIAFSVGFAAAFTEGVLLSSEGGPPRLLPRNHT